MLNILKVAFESYLDLGISYATLNNAVATNNAGLAVGCLLFMPFVHKYGRRPLYILSSLIQLMAAIWSACLNTGGELIAANLVSGVGGAISEAIVMITIVDLFFLHQHARLNGLFLLMQSVGSFGGPVAAGFIVDSQGWRWMWWWTTIFLGLNFVLVCCFFEETKYVPISAVQTPRRPASVVHEDGLPKMSSHEHLEEMSIRSTSDPATPPRNPLSKRLAIVTKSDVSIRQHFYLPVRVLFTFPAVAYAAVTYGLLLAWFAVISSAASYFMLDPPYSFASSSVGLFMISALIGTIIGTIFGAPLSDWSILWLSRRNGGVFEPEMRLWVALVGSLLCTGGILMFGLGLAKSLPWIVLAVGYAIFGVGFSMAGDIALTYLTDCYPDILSDALVGVILVRNGISVLIMFVFTPWVNNLGIQNTFICIALISLIMTLLPIILLVMGKAARARTAADYRKFAVRQAVYRTL
ncbi:hypothetical protein ASPVEDRAFT_50977 [Aspergillus versicolor CBS 583.65]|uniref:Major facilitator superfamily (MFS) profile domain-containing protein n=1 Tax=Aspergillus versicolor CBS 583.65 TaxID=1036611 RepID=A0A1L9PDH4_ASPVE|nr:uncharacterized protein ASPVEDRAFT_50977 [Aspergillus versicolor CBS 583.65]OJI99560.1 hypothetical protein ASPVEDRAFT_50977 [Aspergillus versicolor CBS 583.65]